MPSTNEHHSPPFSTRLLLVGLACLALSVAAAGVLVGKHLNLLEAPGCGAGSPCDAAAASVWGKVPGLGWPTSFVGLAYFLALGLGWLAAYGGPGVTAPLRWLVRLGALGSLVFLVAMIAGGYACLYCIAAHVGNFLFLFVVESAPKGSGRTHGILAWGAAAFVVVTGFEFAVNRVVEGRVRQTLASSTKEIIEATKEVSGTRGGTPFRGRYLAGPERAPIRLVIFSDYQCPDCQRIETEVRELLAERDDLSVSHKHHPFNADCNQYLTRTMHSNACWAARAAEAAGIIGGNEGFWRMHEWLFEHKGVFSDDTVDDMLLELGFEPVSFRRVMGSDETLRRVRADVEEAHEMGIYQTPMIFVNGRELKGWSVPGAVRTVVEALAATNPPPGDASQDQPPLAAEKYVADWREQNEQPFLPDQYAWSLGPDDAKARVVMWGDYQERNTADADRLVRHILESRDDARYTFRHYPIDKKCNPVTPADKHPMACRMAKAAEAAGRLGGNDAYWAMHAWLMDNQHSFTDDRLDAAAIEIGLDPEELFAEMDSTAVAAEIAGDAQAGMRAGLRGVPLIFIDGKYVPRWRMENVLQAMIDEAAAD